MIRLGRQVVPCFRCMFLLDMPSSRSPESSSVILTQSLHRRPWPSPRGGNGSALSILPTIRFKRGALISGFYGFAFATACQVASLLGGSDRVAPAPETFTPRLSTRRSPFALLGMTTVASGPLPPAGLAPAGTAVSIAATPLPRLSQRDLQLAAKRPSKRRRMSSALPQHHSA
jgi:hypothetical protein